MDDELAGAFADASRFLAQAAALVPDDRWDGPGLGTWTLRELAGHANRSHATIEEYLLRPRAPELPGSAYFSAESIAARGREAVAVLGADPAAAVAAASAEAIALVGRTAPDAVVGSPAGTMTLRQYLPSRIAELTVHGLDIVAAAGAALDPPASALRASLAFAAAAAARRGGTKDATAVLLALTGRGALPAGYSIY